MKKTKKIDLNFKKIGFGHFRTGRNLKNLMFFKFLPEKRPLSGRSLTLKVGIFSENKSQKPQKSQKPLKAVEQISMVPEIFTDNQKPQKPLIPTNFNTA